jgi:hypothetical protein
MNLDKFRTPPKLDKFSINLDKFRTPWFTDGQDRTVGPKVDGGSGPARRSCQEQPDRTLGKVPASNTRQSWAGKLYQCSEPGLRVADIPACEAVSNYGGGIVCAGALRGQPPTHHSNYGQNCFWWRKDNSFTLKCARPEPSPRLSQHAAPAARGLPRLPRRGRSGAGPG